MACYNNCNSCSSCNSCNRCNSCNNRVFTPLGGLGMFGRRFPLGGISYTNGNCGCNDDCDCCDDNCGYDSCGCDSCGCDSCGFCG